MNIEILQFCNLRCSNISKMLKNKCDLILELFLKNPHTEYSPQAVAKNLGINYYTVTSSLCRFFLMGKVQKSARGKYVLIPLPEGQSTFDRIAMREN